MTERVITPDPHIPKRWAVILLALAAYEIARAIQEGGNTWRFVAAGFCAFGAFLQFSIRRTSVELDNLEIRWRTPQCRNQSIRWADVKAVEVSPKAVCIRSDNVRINITSHLLPGRMDILALNVFMAVLLNHVLGDGKTTTSAPSVNQPQAARRKVIFIGSQSSKVYHCPSCSAVKTICSHRRS